MREFNNICLPKNIGDVTLKAIDKAENYKTKRKRNRKRIIAASIACFLIIGSAAQSEEVMASIGKAIHKIETFFNGKLKTDVIKDYKSSIGITKESNGAKVTLNEFFMDNENLYINAKFHSRDGKDLVQHKEYKVLLNGEVVTGGNSSGGTFQYNNDNSVEILSTRNMNKVDLKSIRDVTVIFYKITYVKNYKEKNFNKETINGKWEFNFKFDGEKAASSVKDMDINKTINLKDRNMTVHTLKATPMNFSIDVTFDRDLFNEEGFTTIGVLNDKGQLIESDGGGGGEILTTKIIMDTSGVKEVTLVPYKVTYKKNIFGQDKTRYKIYKDKAFKIDLTK